MRVLLADTDKDYLDVTAYALRRAGFEVEAAGCGTEARDLLQGDHWDIVVLDAELEDASSLELCQLVRKTSNSPVVMLGHAKGEVDMVAGFQAGVDDWISKPFSFAQLVATLEAICRRTNGQRSERTPSRLEVGRLTIDVDAFTATVSGCDIGLTRQEFLMLYILAANANRMVPLYKLMEFAWDEGAEPNPVLVRAVLSHIRAKLREKGLEQISIQALPGVGYKLTLGADLDPEPDCDPNLAEAPCLEEREQGVLSVLASLNGHDGQNGHNGHDVQNGHNGHDVQNGHNGENGQNGHNGHVVQNGHNGENGHSGQNGHNGHNGHGDLLVVSVLSPAGSEVLTWAEKELAPETECPVPAYIIRDSISAGAAHSVASTSNGYKATPELCGLLADMKQRLSAAIDSVRKSQEETLVLASLLRGETAAAPDLQLDSTTQQH